MNILAIESSCDETAVAVVRDGRTVLSDAIASQADMHALYGGVVPEIASRKHIEAIAPLCDRALREAARDWETENLADAVIKEREETFRVEERDGGRVGVLEIQYLAEMDIAQPRKLEVVPPADDQSGTG